MISISQEQFNYFLDLYRYMFCLTTIVVFLTAAHIIQVIVDTFLDKHKKKHDK